MVGITAFTTFGSLETFQSLLGVAQWVAYFTIIAIAWKLVWYGVAMYKSMKRSQEAWFVSFFPSLLLNDLGLLAIIYLFANRGIESVK